LSFRDNFLWGAATAAYQVEGAAAENGKGPSIWDIFSHIPGKIYQNENGDIACDHLHRFQEDIGFMKQIGIKAYRFSVSWPRILPEGTGKINESGLRFYEELVDTLNNNGIIPCVTLYHWDYPAALQMRGGWLNPSSPLWFHDYVKIIAKRFAGKVKCYFTLNEPQCFIGLGYGTGDHAPGWRLSPPELLTAMHHVLLAHGLAVSALREYGGKDLQIGLAQCGRIYIPATDSPDNILAAKRATIEAADSPQDLVSGVAMWSDPIFKGKYPSVLWQKYGNWMPQIGPDDMKIISTPIDFYAQNIYTSSMVCAAENGYRILPYPHGCAKNSMGWPVIPSCMYWAPKFLYEAYHKPIIISENGFCALDAVSLDGKVHDMERINYTHRHLLELKRAAEEGVDISGYFYWSLMDNFEWSHGYKERFGLIYLDYETQNRILKDSALWYRDVICQNGKNL
jgi:beta-glucosidase